MYQIIKNLSFAAVLLYGFSACNNTTPTTPTPTPTPPTSETRGGLESHQFMGQSVQLNKFKDIITIQKRASNAAQADAEAISAIRGNLGVAKNQQALEVQFSASDEPVTNGMFIFSIETEAAKELTMELYDEEDFELAGNNAIGLTNGRNYKALNVTELPSGKYTFRLRDDEGKELTREVNVQNKK